MGYVEDRVRQLKAESESKSQLRTDDNVKMSLSVDSERRLKAENLAIALNNPDVDFVERNYGLLERSARTTGVYDSLPDNSVTKNVLSSPQERAMLPDAENLGKIEQTITNDVQKSFSRGWAMEKAVPELFSNMIAGGEGFGELYAPVALTIGEDTDSELNFIEQVPGQSAEALGQMAAQQRDALIAGGYAAAGGAAATAPAGGTGAVPAFGAGYALGSAKQIFEAESTYAYADLRQLTGDDGEPVPHDVAMGAALLVGGINTIPEFGGRVFSLLGLGKPSSLLTGFTTKAAKELIKTPVGRRAFGKIAASYAGGIAVEGLTEAFQELSLEYAKVLISDVSEISWESVLESGTKGVQAAIGLGAPGATVKSTVAAIDTKRTNDLVAAFEALGKDASNSEVLKNAPKKFQEFIRQVQERHGTVDTIYLDSEKAIELFQDVDMTNMPETARELAEAQTLSKNGYIAIPLEEFVSEVAPSENLAEFYQDMTFSPDSPTPRMVEESKAESEAIRQEYVDSDLNTEDGSLYSQIRTELIASGRVEDVATPEAEFMASIITRVANRQGVDPLQFYRDKNISIVGETVESGEIDIPTRVGGMLNVLREGKGPTQKDVFGESLVEMLISRGGLEVNSELTARDLEKGNKEYGGRKLARDGGVSLSEAFEVARDRGYLSLGEFASEEAAILDAIDRELNSGRVYGDAQASPGVQNLADDLAALERALDELGIDINELDNDAILEALGVNELNHDMPPRAFLREQYDVEVDQILYQAANIEDVPGTPAYESALAKFGPEGMTTEARLARAKEQGYDTDNIWYHGTANRDITGFNDNTFLTRDSREAEWYSESAGDTGDSRQMLYPAYLKGEKVFDIDNLQDYEVLRSINESVADAMKDMDGRWDYVEPYLSTSYAQGSAIRKSLIDAGYTGIYVREGEMRFPGDELERTMMVFDPANIRSVNAAFDPDFAGSDNLLAQGGKKPRGSLSFNNARDYFKVTLTDKANLSTFVHESGHLFLELMREAALGGGIVDQTLLDDYEAIKKFVGNTDDNFTVEQHELLARAMEQYVREGKAPSAELRGVFQKLKGFMLSVYKYAASLRAPLNDEIRFVFDRALAADDAIAAAENSVFESIPDASIIGQEAYNKLVRLQAEAVQQATDDIEAIVLADIKKRQQAVYKKRRDALTKQVTAEVNAEPVYAAQSGFRGAQNENVPEGMEGKKLSSNEVVSLFGGDKSVLSKHFAFMYGSENTVPADFAADVYGFKNGYEMLQAISAAPKKADAIKARVNAQLDSEFGNVLQDTDLNNEAVQLMENSKLEDFILASNRAISKLAKTKTPRSLALATVKAARQHLSTMTLRQIRPDKYYQAEKKSQRLEAEALGKRDYPLALKHNRERLLNHHLYREATKIQKEAERIRKNLNGITPKTLERIRIADKENSTHYASTITSLLASVEFKKTSYRQIDARRALGEYVQAMEDAGETVLVDPKFYIGVDLINYKEMSIDELTELNDSVNSLRKMGNTANTVMVDGRRIRQADAVEAMEESAAEHADRKAVKRMGSEDTRLLAKGTRFFSAANSTLRKVEMIANAMDGGLNGVWFKTIFLPFVSAQRAADALKEKTNTRLKEIWSTATVEDTERLNQRRMFRGMEFKVLDLYTVVLNMGNESNLDRLLKGNSVEIINGKPVKVPGWEKKDVGSILRELQEILTLEDFKRIEQIGQLTDSFYPEMAAVSERVDGRIPPKVEANPFYLEKYGITMSGWYYPVVYVNEAGTPERQALVDGNDISMGASPITGQVSKSMTKERSDGVPNGRISTDMGVFSSHVNKVIHYTTHYEAIKNFDSLRKRNDFRSMYEEFLSPEDYKALRDWVQNIATNGDLAKANDQASQFFNKGLRGMRFGTSLLAMGYNIGTGLMQPLGLLTAQAELGGLYMAKAITKYSYGAVTGALPSKRNMYFDTALSQSSELRHIDTQMDRDIREYGKDKSRLLPQGTAMNMFNLVRDNPFILILEIQKRVNAITFMAAQEKATAEGFQGQDVIDYAESAVRVTQSGGGLKDLAGIQSGSEIAKSITPFYTYFSVLYNRLYETGRKDLLRGFIRGDNKEGRMTGAHAFAMNMVWLVLGQAIVEELMRGNPDDEDFWVSVAKRTGGTVVTSVPVARDLLGAYEWFGGFDASTPLTRWMKAVGQGTTGAWDVITGEANWTDVRNVLKVGTMTTGLPFYPAAKILEAAQQDDVLGMVRGSAFGVPYKDRPDLMEAESGGF